MVAKLWQGDTDQIRIVLYIVLYIILCIFLRVADL
jgi:hypothetical protein